MAIARGEFTVSNLSDGATGRGISSIVEQFYLSTSKTTQTGGSWSTTMPTWEPGKYVWTRSLITYTTGTPATETTTPLVSSEWEAANNVKDYVQSRGENLVTNGTALLKNNTNFSAFTFDGYDSVGANGSFTTIAGASGAAIDELIPINPNLTYRMSYYIKASPYVGARAYGYVSCYDSDGLVIGPQNTAFRSDTLTELASELKNGDTTVHLVDASNWDNEGTAGVSTNLRSLIFWNYVNSSGYPYPPLTYSRNYVRNAWDPGSIDFVSNTVTLRVPWEDGTYPAGTKVSNGTGGGTFKYIAGYNFVTPADWTKYSGTIGGIDYSGADVSSKFRPGTATVKVGWLLNREISGGKAWLSNVSFNIDVASPDDVRQSVVTHDADLTAHGIKFTEISQTVNGLGEVVGTHTTNISELTAASLEISQTLEKGGENLLPNPTFGTKNMADKGGWSTGYLMQLLAARFAGKTMAEMLVTLQGKTIQDLIDYNY